MKHVISILVCNHPGVLVRVASMFSRREFNIDSLAVGITESPDFSRITVVMQGDSYLVSQMIKRLDVLKIAELFRAHVIDVEPTTLIFEITGSDDKVTAFMQLLAPYGVLEVIRTGLIGLSRGEDTLVKHSGERQYYGKNLL